MLTLKKKIQTTKANERKDERKDLSEFDKIIREQVKGDKKRKVKTKRQDVIRSIKRNFPRMKNSEIEDLFVELYKELKTLGVLINVNR